jgi:hypothetical protein
MLAPIFGKTIRAVFPTVYVFPVDLGPKGSVEAVRNIIVVATSEPAISPAEIVSRAPVLVERRIVTVDRFLAAAGALYTAPIPTGDVPLLTDDFAPVDGLIPAR